MIRLQHETSEDKLVFYTPIWLRYFLSLVLARNSPQLFIERIGNISTILKSRKSRVSRGLKTFTAQSYKCIRVRQILSLRVLTFMMLVATAIPSLSRQQYLHSSLRRYQLKPRPVSATLGQLRPIKSFAFRAVCFYNRAWYASLRKSKSFTSIIL